LDDVGENNVETSRTTRNIQIDTGDITPIISDPSVSNKLRGSIDGDWTSGRGKDLGEIDRRTVEL